MSQAAQDTSASPSDAWHHTLAQAVATPLSPDRKSALLMSHGSMTLRYYAPKGVDDQTPHDKDELYIVASGHGGFLRNGERVEFGPGDVLFAAAGDDHRFVDFSDDFGTWVVFYGAKGGEAATA